MLLSLSFAMRAAWRRPFLLYLIECPPICSDEPSEHAFPTQVNPMETGTESGRRRRCYHQGSAPRYSCHGHKLRSNRWVGVIDKCPVHLPIPNSGRNEWSNCWKVHDSAKVTYSTFIMSTPFANYKKGTPCANYKKGMSCHNSFNGTPCPSFLRGWPCPKSMFDPPDDDDDDDDWAPPYDRALLATTNWNPQNTPYGRENPLVVSGGDQQPNEPAYSTGDQEQRDLVDSAGDQLHKKSNGDEEEEWESWIDWSHCA
ncbi:hypothetical protein EJ06DRAFT_521560 [Trichodelitschia bisporula]|uniref:Uncharacterized protein n=1 Tax=Trichodelitschia bisporula TaxID=703511 RepID=A0A6G1HYA4_9PEZI|nr:hypothetical protein EJ06DRAFT_521560 [Trichodelitschia bisporula]